MKDMTLFDKKIAKVQALSDAYEALKNLCDLYTCEVEYNDDGSSKLVYHSADECSTETLVKLEQIDAIMDDILRRL